MRSLYLTVVRFIVGWRWRRNNNNVTIFSKGSFTNYLKSLTLSGQNGLHVIVDEITKNSNNTYITVCSIEL